MNKEIMDKIMRPKSIAIIGASTKLNAIGGSLLNKLLNYGYKGKVYPINIKGGIIQGLQSYKKLEEVQDEIDLAVIVINVKLVLSSIDECNKKGIKGIVIITAGFKETGEEGAEIERKLGEKIKEYGMVCVGPNCLGVVNTNPEVQMDACFAETLPKRGNVGLVSQSGALGGGMMNVLNDYNFGIAQFISIGNQVDVNVETILEYWEDDEDIHQILIYMESIKNPKNFWNLASRISKKKPIIALKAGRSAEGALAATSHTGSLAGSDVAANALLIQSGVIREFYLRQLFETSKAMIYSPIPKGDRVAIITNSGGPGIMATDSVVDFGMRIAQLSEKSKSELRSFLPAHASVLNPIDMIASAPLEHYKRTIDIVLNDENVDMVLTIYLPFLGLKDIYIAEALMEAKKKYPDKPIFGVIMTDNKFFTDLSSKGVNMPFYMCSEEATEGLNRLNQQRKWKSRPEGKIPTFDNINKEKAIGLLKNAISENRKLLSVKESLDILEAYGISTCKYEISKNEDEAVNIANKIGYPVVMKMSSKTVTHKTDIGGIVLDINNEESLRKEYKKIIQKLTDKNLIEGLDGIVIQQQISGDREFSCGITTDPSYGKLIMFGLGGIYIEAIKDFQFRICPINDQDAKDMIRDIKSYKLLQEYRNKPAANIEVIENMLLRLSQLVCDFGFINELDINPLMISDKNGEAISVDGRIVLDLENAKKDLK